MVVAGSQSGSIKIFDLTSGKGWFTSLSAPYPPTHTVTDKQTQWRLEPCCLCFLSCTLATRAPLQLLRGSGAPIQQHPGVWVTRHQCEGTIHAAGASTQGTTRFLTWWCCIRSGICVHGLRLSHSKATPRSSTHFSSAQMADGSRLAPLTRPSRCRHTIKHMPVVAVVRQVYT